ncbi:hypothetical protein PHMEG_00035552, partial [Phytophthora megakarya]
MAFYDDSLDQTSLCMLFGVPPPTQSHVLNDTDDVMASALVGPTLVRQKALAKLVAAREPLLQFTWGFLDGQNFTVLQPSEPNIQNVYYNGADALIVWSKHNCPGSWNDDDTSLGFREALSNPLLDPDSRHEDVADSAFPSKQDMRGRILTPLNPSSPAILGESY